MYSVTNLLKKNAPIYFWNLILHPAFINLSNIKWLIGRNDYVLTLVMSIKFSLMLKSSNIKKNKFQLDFLMVMGFSKFNKDACETQGEICSYWHEGAPDWALAPPNF